MLSIFITGSFVMGLVFSLANFKFISVLLLLENFNILVLLTTYVCGCGFVRTPFLVFMVVATIEVTLALVSLSRLWDSDCLYY